MKELLLIILTCWLFITVCIGQKVYRNAYNEKITVVNDSIIEFDFIYPEAFCIAKYNKVNNRLFINDVDYTVQIDTLYNQSCKGFYIENVDVYLKHKEGHVILPDPLFPDFFPFSFESDSIQFEFKQPESNLKPFIINGLTSGCYRLNYVFSSCIFLDFNKLGAVFVKKRELIFNDQKYKLIKK